MPTSVAPAISSLPGYRHELGVYASDDEFGDLVCPFALGGVLNSEPVVFAYDPPKMALLTRWLPESPRISFVTSASSYETPARALVAWRRTVEDHLAAGARRVRIAGNVPHPGYGRTYSGWDRYEAAIERAWGDLPVLAACLYDARLAPADVIERAVRQHRHIIDRHGAHRLNKAFVPADRLCDFLAPPPDVLQASAPTLELVDPIPRAVRVAVGQSSDDLTATQRDDLVLAASEAVVNALVHGKPPVVVRIWLGERRVIVDVHDKGEGPTDPLAGLLARPVSSESGRGLQLVHQLELDVALIARDDGFTLRMRAGDAA